MHSDASRGRSGRGRPFLDGGKPMKTATTAVAARDARARRSRGADARPTRAAAAASLPACSADLRPARSSAVRSRIPDLRRAMSRPGLRRAGRLRAATGCGGRWSTASATSSATRSRSGTAGKTSPTDRAAICPVRRRCDLSSSPYRHHAYTPRNREQAAPRPQAATRTRQCPRRVTSCPCVNCV